ncbi:Uncharacterised protein [Salmonella bongori]|nr:Uncharacterised protein [Salmonella bongori]
MTNAVIPPAQNAHSLIYRPVSVTHSWRNPLTSSIHAMCRHPVKKQLHPRKADCRGLSVKNRSSHFVHRSRQSGFPAPSPAISPTGAS